MEFEWDEAKNRTNQLKHGLRFEDVLDVFDDPKAITEQARLVGGEVRFQTIGRAGGFMVVFVVHTQRAKDGAPSARLISARRASRKERERYDSGNTQDRSV